MPERLAEHGIPAEVEIDYKGDISDKMVEMVELGLDEEIRAREAQPKPLSAAQQLTQFVSGLTKN